MRAVRHAIGYNLLLGLVRAIDDHADKRLAHLDLRIFRNPDHEAIVFYVGNRTVDTAGRHDFVPSAQLRKHFLVSLLLLPLRRDHQKVHRRKQEPEEN